MKPLHNKPEDEHPRAEAFQHLLKFKHGLEGAGEALRVLVNEASKIERDHYLKAKSFERSAEPVDYANGFKNKTMRTRLGEIEFAVPQVR